MKEFFKVSGLRFTLPPPSPQWTISARPGGWMVAVGPEGERQRFSYWEARGQFSANLQGRLIHGELLQERQAGGGGASSSVLDAELVAQFPGKVRRLLVEAGARVKAGEPLILVEAMKMEFTIMATVACLIERVLVKEGQQLSPGDRFFDLVFDGSSKGSRMNQDE